MSQGLVDPVVSLGVLRAFPSALIFLLADSIIVNSSLCHSMAPVTQRTRDLHELSGHLGKCPFIPWSPVDSGRDQNNDYSVRPRIVTGWSKFGC